MSVDSFLDLGTLVWISLTHSWLLVLFLIMLSFYTERKNVVLIVGISFLVVMLHALLTVYLHGIRFSGYYGYAMRVLYTIWIAFFLYSIYKNEKSRVVDRVETIALGLIIGVFSGYYFILLIGAVNDVVETATLGATSFLISELIVLGVVLLTSKVLIDNTTKEQKRVISLVLGSVVLLFSLFQLVVFGQVLFL